MTIIYYTSCAIKYKENKKNNTQIKNVNFFYHKYLFIIY